MTKVQLTRRIKKKEIKKAAWILAECFRDYPLYKEFFPDDQIRLKLCYICFLARVYTRQDYVYVSDDLDLIMSIKRPGNKDRSLAGLIINPKNWPYIMKMMPYFRILNEYSAMADEIKKKYYYPETDNEIQMIGVRKEARCSGLIFRVLRQQIEIDEVYYAETHEERLCQFYQKLGMELCETAKWRGVTHYVLKRKKQKTNNE